MIPRSYLEIQPSARLAAYVECYWSLAERQRGSNNCILPDGCVDILFSRLRGEPVALNVVGLMTKPLPYSEEATQSFFGVRFRPGMAAAFLREAALLTDRTVPLESIWGSTARMLFAQLAYSRSPEGMAQAVDRFLRPAEPPDPTQHALRHLFATTTPLDQLVSNAGVSERHFRRACVERAGVAPKYLRRILRFRKVAEKIRASAASAAQPSWAQLAVACGYYDQAHFIRDFQEFAGCTPGRFVQSLRHSRDLESKNDEPIQS